MSENINVQHAFDPELRQAQADMDVFAAPRAFEDANGRLRTPNGKFTSVESQAKAFEANREAHFETTTPTSYEEMSLTELADKWADAEQHEDKTTIDDVMDVVLAKIQDKYGQYDKADNEYENTQDRMLDRVLKLKDKKLAEKTDVSEAPSSDTEQNDAEGAKPFDWEEDEKKQAAEQAIKDEYAQHDFSPEWDKEDADDSDESQHRDYDGAVDPTQELVHIPQDGESPKLRFRDRLRKAKNSIGASAAFASTGNIKELFRNPEKKSTRNKVLLGAAALGLAAVTVVLAKRGDIDLIPTNGRLIGDGDGVGVDLAGIKLGDGTNSHEHLNEIADALTPNGGKGGAEAAAELVPVNVVEGGGTSHVAESLGIDFNSEELWNQFNAQTNPLFEGLDGVTFNPNKGIYEIASPGNFQVPQGIIDEMQRVADEIHSAS